jgi:hypothetical protein
MNNTVRALAAVLAFVALNAIARGNVAVMNHEAVPATTASGKPASAEQIRAALVSAGAARGWQITPTGNGKALAVLDVRGKHRVSADITYASGQYSIKYRDSSNMNFDAKDNTIHPKYNMWVQALIDDTRAQLAR